MERYELFLKRACGHAYMTLNITVWYTEKREIYPGMKSLKTKGENVWVLFLRMEPYLQES